MPRLLTWVALVVGVSGCSKWGTLANPGFDGKPIRTILFFAGQQLDGKTLPQNICPALPGNITGDCQTAWPLDQRYLDWTNPENRVLAVRRIAELGFNTISMSSWGESWLPCTTECPDVPPECCEKVERDATCQRPITKCFRTDDRQLCRIGWYGSANTQLSPAAKNELFEAALEQNVLIIPFLESRFDFDWNFRTDFPYSQDPRFRGQLAPGLISQIEDLIRTYLQDPNHPKWKDKWALVYDSVGEKRYAIAIVQAASDSLEACDDERFAAAFNQVAQKVYADTGVKVGFFIDPIPRYPDPAVTYGCRDVRGPIISTYDARFRPDPDATGPWLYKQSSILGIHAYSPEGWIDAPKGHIDECLKIAWKEDFSRRWQATGIPFLQDVTPGYDGSRLFGKWPGLHRWGYTANWRASLVEMVSRYGRKGMVYNSWNGYCEGLAAMETEPQKSANADNVDFIHSLMSKY